MVERDDLEYVRILKEEYYEYGQLNRLFNLSGDLLCIAGFNGYFKRINPAVSKLLGYTEEELYSRPINDFVFEDDKNVTANGRNNIYKGSPLLNFENRYQTKSGEIVWLSWTSIPDLEQEVVFAIAKNVTDRKLHEAERGVYMANLAKINDDLKKYTRMTSHDIRSPVSNLLSIFTLIDFSKIKDQETSQLVRLLQKTSERLHETVNSYVDILIKNDQTDVTVEEVNIPVCLKTVTDSVHAILLESGSIISSDFSAFKCIPFNKMYMESILLNLITNAIKYANPDRAPIIKITARMHNGVKQLIIADNGSGFDMEKVKDKIFGLYQVFHANKESKGIGLHLVHTHVSTMGGEITVDSKLKEGSTFTISFKREQDAF